MIETATSACSVALIADGAVVAAEHAIVGRGHAERLLPMIAALPGGGRADQIWVDCGPGSFTGIRVGIAAARALGFGWGAPVSGYSSLALIAAAWFATHDDRQVTVVIEGGHGELFVQPFAADPLRATAALVSVAADEAGVAGPLVGNAAKRLSTDAEAGDPDASRAILLPDAPLPVTPIYGRAPDAKPAPGATI